MAVEAHEVKIVAGDRELGTTAEIENVAVVMDLGDGRVGIFTVQAQVPDVRL